MYISGLSLSQRTLPVTMSEAFPLMPNVVVFPVGSVVLEREVADFHMPPPKIDNAGLVPPHVAQVLHRSWVFPHNQHKICFHVLKNVYVSGEGLVFDSDNNVFSETIAQNDPSLVAKAFWSLLEHRAAGDIPFIPGPTLLCGKIGMSNYGHWMVEMLPVAYVSRYWLQNREWRLFLPKVYTWMENSVRESLDLLHIPVDQRVENDGSPVLFEELIVVSGISAHGLYYLPVCIECMDAIAEAVPSDQTPRVWISRSGERRTLLDEDKIGAELKDRGWRVVHPGRMSLREQIGVAKGARHMAGVNGAGLTNMGFMQAGNVLTTFMPATMPDVFYWSLAVHRRLDYREVRVPVLPSAEWHIEWDGVLQISQPDVFRYLEANLQERSFINGSQI